MVTDDLIDYLSAQTANGPTTAITAITAAAAAVVTAVAHGLTTGANVSISGTNSTPPIDGIRVVTVIDANSFSVPVTTSGPGTTGTFQVGCGTEAVDLFEHALPDAPLAPDLAAVLNEYGGLPPDTAFGTADVYREHPRVQVSVRGLPRDVQSGRTRIETIYRVIGRIPWPLTIGATKYWGVRLLQSPFWLKVDEKWRHVFVFNVQFHKDPAP